MANFFDFRSVSCGTNYAESLSTLESGSRRLIGGQRIIQGDGMTHFIARMETEADYSWSIEQQVEVIVIEFCRIDPLFDSRLARYFRML